ncbi:hypothetical protein [Enterovibrio norvegicus]|uniref:Uncharacterized protein n=1 Tax=Enterovibrio norvegicus TaxID=188144 RepID=A0A2N7LH33_9GAMM|nr:hypothetical protein [Enterovibrio norvegicus]PMN64470.1 hypothetical protein BCT27_10960 [Enterovibrio norvegicus]PMN94862.1 hypothetical protein BCT23_02175 [Enterovibrio norvegicus]
MTQAVDFGHVVTSVDNSQKSYAVSIKGLFAHAMDILQTRQVNKTLRSTSDLPDHIKRDIGLIR